MMVPNQFSTSPPPSIESPRARRSELVTPRTHGSVLAIPPLNMADVAIAENQRRLNRDDVIIGQQSLLALRTFAREELLPSFNQRTAHWLDQEPKQIDFNAPLIVTGHQPQFSHPGVWAKNFATAEIARRTNGNGLNLIVDTDLAERFEMNVPAGTRTAPKVETFAFDESRLSLPWCEARVKNRILFHSFGERVEDAVQQWGMKPILPQMWLDAVNMSDKTDSMATALSVARMKQERRWGIANLEAPIHRMCQSKSFSMFVAAMILDQPRFTECYNAAVDWYRETYGVRNNRHPVPNLAPGELPLWHWKQNSRQRNRVFVVVNGKLVQLKCGDETITLASHPAKLIQQLSELQRTQRLVPRALTTTLFTRMILADLFLHGIGGAKYDAVTDHLMTHYYGIEAPEFLTVSATMHLDLKPFSVSKATARELQQQRRHLQFNPEKFLSTSQSPDIVAEKKELIAKGEQSRENGLTHQQRLARRPNNRLRHKKIKAATEQLLPLVKENLAQLDTEIGDITAKLNANRVLQSREFAAVLHDESELKKLFFETMPSGAP